MVPKVNGVGICKMVNMVKVVKATTTTKLRKAIARVASAYIA